MPSARVLIWGLALFLALGAVAFAAVASFFGVGFLTSAMRWFRGWREFGSRRRFALRDAFDPMRGGDAGPKVLPEARAFFKGRKFL